MFCTVVSGLNLGINLLPRKGETVLLRNKISLLCLESDFFQNTFSYVHNGITPQLALLCFLSVFTNVSR